MSHAVVVTGEEKPSTTKLVERLKKDGMTPKFVPLTALEAEIQNSKEADALALAAPAASDQDDIVILKVVRRHANYRTLEGGY